MYYVKVEENELVKYEITLDEKKLKAIKREILHNCGMVKHYDYEATSCKYEEYDEHVANFSSNFSKTIDRDYNDESYYRYTYDYYSDTQLTNLIDELLKGNACAYEKIKNYDSKNNDEYSNKKEQEIKENLYKLSSKFVDSSLKKELENLKIEIDSFLLNKDIQNDIEYKNKVLECITIKEINRISNSDWEQAKEQIKQIDEMIIKPKGLLDLLNTTLLDGTFENNIEIAGYQDAVSKIYQKNK